MSDAPALVAVHAKSALPAQSASAQPVVHKERKISQPPVTGPLPANPASIPSEDDGHGGYEPRPRMRRSVDSYAPRSVSSPHLRAWSSQRSAFAPPLLPLQRKLTVGSVSDPLEAEADSIADRVMNDSPRRLPIDGALALRRQATGSVPSVEAPSIVHETLRSPGQPLDRQTRASMESRFGYDLSRVRLHTDAKSAESARAVGAHAYAVGQHIAFDAGAFNPHSVSGRNLLAHELAHTLQQSESPAGAHDGILRRRRIPQTSSVDDLIGPGKTDRSAHIAGLMRLIRNAWKELSPDRKTAAGKQAALALISRIEISLQSHPGFFQSSDDWNIQSVVVRLLTGSASKAEIVNQSGTPLVRLTKKAPSIRLAATAPAGATGPFDQIQFRILTGSDDLRGNSTAVATLFTSAGFTLARLALKQQSDPAWDKNSTHTPAFNLALAMPPDADLFAALEAGNPQQMEEFAREIQVAFPKDVLGDPALIDTGPRPATADAANIGILVSEAEKIFKAVASGSHNADLRDVFGPTHVAQAKVKFAKARTAMHHLHTLGKIVTDRSGYDAEVSLGGLTSDKQIALDPDTIDNPSNPESIATTVHESMHAGNSADVTDLGYIGSASFTEMTAADKLNNAADYEVIANRILTPAAANAFPGKKFIPAGTTVGGVSAPPLTQRQSAMREASETFRRAWTTALNLHTLFVRVFKRPAEWDTLDLNSEFGVAAGTHFSDSFPFWSKVENMTIHRRPGISPAAGASATNPVTLIDVAQSESVTRKLAAGMDATDSSKLSEANAVDLEKKANAAQTADIAKGPIDEARVLVSLIRSEKTGEITGQVERDERLIARLSDAEKAAAFFDDVLSPKSPSTFAD